MFICNICLFCFIARCISLYKIVALKLLYEYRLNRHKDSYYRFQRRRYCWSLLKRNVTAITTMPITSSPVIVRV